VTCSVGNLAVGASATFTINVTTPATAGTITNTATVAGNESDPNTANNTASATTSVTAPTQADLSITKTGPVTATTSSPITYTVVAKNNGPVPATGVGVTDTLPAGVTFVSASSTQGTCTNASGTVTCPVGNLAVGATVTITINVTAPVSPGSITNTAVVAGNEFDPNTANNRASAATQIQGTGTADMSITKMGPGTAQVTSTMTYTLVATDNGPSPATGVVVTDPLPAGVTFLSASSTEGTCTNASGTVTCTVGSLAAGASATITIKVMAPTKPGAITNTATVKADQPDPNTANNTASVTTTIGRSVRMSDVSVAKYGFDDDGDINSPTVGDPFYYALVVHNFGPNDATNVVVTDTLPAGVTFNWVFTTQGTCTNASGTVTCNIPTLVSQGSKSTAYVAISVTPNSTGTISNTATVKADQADPNPANNSSTLVSTVGSQSQDTDDF
jgi:uncharacterized repeat protein (TIGR01451 family)